MKAICEREKLLHAFQTAAGVAPTRSPKPILQNLKLEVTPEAAMLVGTDMEIGIRMVVPGFVIEEPGSAVLPISRFGSILRESSDEKLQSPKRRAKNPDPRRPQRISIAQREPR